MKKKTLFMFAALLMTFAMVLPMFAGCQSEEPATTTAQEVLQPETEEKFVPQGPTDVLPENRLDYENSESLVATPNVGKGSVVESSTQLDKSEYTIELEKASKSGEVRRETALAAMKESLSVLWTPREDVTYSYHPNSYTKIDSELSQTDDFNKNQIALKAGQMYQGIPYTHGSAGLTAFLAATDCQITVGTKTGNYPLQFTNCTDGKLAEGVEEVFTPCAIEKKDDGSYVIPLNSQILSGSNAVSARLGADGIDALYWAWATTGSEIFFTDLATFLKDSKVKLLGDYKAEDSDTAAILGSDLARAKAAYATLGMADALVSGVGGEERALMVISVDAAAGTVTVMEQTPANIIAAQGKTLDVISFGTLSQIYTFDELFQAGFVPATNVDFHHNGLFGSAWYYCGYRSKTAWNKINGAFADTVTAGKRIAYVKIGVSVKDGPTFGCVAFPTEEEILSGMYFTADLDLLAEASDNGLLYGYAFTQAELKAYRNGGWTRIRTSIGFADGTEVGIRDFWGTSKVES